ncbi:MAG: flippase [Bacteriovoracaceae bacterium]|nr:flippase [Bacteriovoracaceae bacterium]
MKDIATNIIQRIRSNRDLSSVLSNASFLLSENVLRLILGFGVGVVVARHLGPEGYGRFSYVLSFVLMFSPFFVMGVDEATVKSLVETPNEKNQILGTASLLKLIGGLLGVTASTITILILRPEDHLTINFVILYSSFSLFKCFDVISCYHQSILKMKRVALFRSCALLFSASLKLYFIHTEQIWTSFIAVSCVEVAAFAVAYFFAYRLSRYSMFDFRFDINRAKSLLKISFPVFISIFLAMALSSIDHIMVGDMVGSEELGQYATSAKFIFLWKFLPAALIASIFPKIVESKSSDQEQYIHRVKLLYGSMFWFSFLFAISVNLVGRPLVLALYGAEYATAGDLLRYHAWIAIFYFYTLSRTQVFLIQGMLRFSVISSGLILLLFTSLCFYLIPSYKSYGAIWALIASYIVVNIVMSIASKSFRNDCIVYFKGIVYPFKLLKDSK